MILLKQSTAATVRVGPFVDITDGVTPETGVTLSGADQAEILKASGGVVDISGATWAAITNCAGWYDLSVTTSHSDTLGMLTVVVQDADVALPVFVRAMVVPAMIWDSLVGGTDVLQTDVTQFGGTNATTSGGRPEVNTTHAAGTAWGSGAITAASIASNAITDAKINTGAITAAKFAAGAIDAAAIADNAIDAGAIASNAITAAKIASDAITDAKIASGALTTAKFTEGALQRMGSLTTGTLSGTHSSTTADLGTNAPANDITGMVLVFPDDEIAVLITAYNTGTGVATFDAVGVTLTNGDNWILFPSPASSSSAPVPASLSSTELAKFFTTDTGETYGDAVAGSVVKEIADNAGGSSLTVQDIVDGVWDEARSAHTDAGSFGQGVASVQGNVTGSVGSVSGAVGSVTGNVGGNVTGSVGSVTGAVGSVTGNVGGTVNGLTSTAQGNVRTAVGLASANLDTQLSTIDSEIGTIDTVVDAIKVTTDKLDDTLEDDGGTFRFTANALEEAPSGGGGTDWDADERTAIRTILGIPASGTTPDTPSDGVLADILEDTGTTLPATLSTIDGEVGQILEDTATTIPATLSDIETDTQNIQSRLPTALVSGRMNSNVAAVNGVVVQGSGTNGDSMRPA